MLKLLASRSWLRPTPTSTNMAKRTYIATIEIEKPEDSFHLPWVFEHSITCAVADISGGKVTVSVTRAPEPVGFWKRWFGWL
jgi:hypothetical protein